MASPSDTAAGDRFPTETVVRARVVVREATLPVGEDTRRTRRRQTRSRHSWRGGMAMTAGAKMRELDGEEQRGKWAFLSQ
jgi:hypothetical protein